MKLSYYKEHRWERRWIDEAYKIVLAIYDEFYAPPEVELRPTLQEGVSHGLSEHDLTFQFFKRPRIERENELEKYLEANIAQPTIKLLDWWKVRNSSFTNNFYIIFSNIYLT
jgi:hypothetical protein